MAENWKDFESSWGYYFLATQLQTQLKAEDGTPKPEGRVLVAATLCTLMGIECQKVMKSLPSLTEADKKDHERILAELKAHFIPQRHVLFERYKFNIATQYSMVTQREDTIDEFVVRLRQLAASCEFEALKDSLIRDRLVIGTTDEGTRDRLLKERPVPDLNRCIESLRASELSRSHKQQMSVKPESTVHYMQGRPKQKAQYGAQNKETWQKRTPPPSNNSNTNNSNKACHWCGNTPSHSRKDCPASKSKCSVCKKVGHYAKVCLSARSVNEVEDSDTVDVAFLGEVEPTGNFWTVDLHVNEQATTFKLDSGAGVTIIGDHTSWLKMFPPQPNRRQFRGAGNVDLTDRVIGHIPKARLKVGGNTIMEDIFIMRGQKHNLLSKSACQRLNLLKPAESVYNVEGSPDFRSEFPQLFTGLGCLESPYRISLLPDAVPVCLYTARTVPHPLLKQVEKQLKTMKKQGVISVVTEPTAWCSGMVCAPKPDGKVRICVDLTPLNKAVQREIHPMASVDENLAKLKGSQFFSKLDANSGFWQIPLDRRSRLLTTFVTPFGRFCFNRIPFGISSAPEIFQRTMSGILLDLDGVICHMDDVLVHAPTQTEHDHRVRTVMERLEKAGLTLNDKKCEFSKNTITFLGHVITPEGIQGDPKKVKAIFEFPPPTNVTELQRFNGMVNQFSKFIPDLASLNKPLRQLLRKDTVWIWDTPQVDAFNQIKAKMASTETLAHYDPNRKTIVAADACDYGVGAVLLQVDQDRDRRPVYYASRSLSETEQRYATIEKEALASTWACEKFSDYILGMQFTLETDHKPLVPLLASKDLSGMPPRILRFRLRMMRFAPTVVHVPGKDQVTADALSRAPVDKPSTSDISFIEEVEEFASLTVKYLPATEVRLRQICRAQDEDAVCTEVKAYCKNGWPGYMPQQPLLRPYWEKRSHLTLKDELLMYDDRIVVPQALQLEVLGQLHQGHLGVTKCRARAMQSVWWPLSSKQIEAMCNLCHICALHRPERKEPLLPSSFPSYAWERIGTDLFELDKKTYIVVVDYYSRWIEIRRLLQTTSAHAIEALKSIFSTHGIPDYVVSDNGPQFASRDFKDFELKYGFTHVTSSPMYPQSNGEAERAVQTAKNIMKKNVDQHLGFLAYHTAPLQNGQAPCQLLMGRNLRSTLPTTPAHLHQGHDKEIVRANESLYRQKMADNYNRRHRTVTLPVLEQGDRVWVRDQDRYGAVVERTASPRAYRVETETGSVITRNRRALVHTGDNSVQQDIPSPQPSSPPRTPVQEPTTGMTTRSQSGREINPPQRLDL